MLKYRGVTISHEKLGNAMQSVDRIVRVVAKDGRHPNKLQVPCYSYYYSTGAVDVKELLLRALSLHNCSSRQQFFTLVMDSKVDAMYHVTYPFSSNRAGFLAT